MNVLVACEESQAVTTEFRRLGHEAYSCDVLECSGGHPEWHIKGDALALINGRCIYHTIDGQLHEIGGAWDLLIAHPPCTYLSNAGARHLYKGGTLNEDRYKKGLEAKAFFMAMYNAKCPRIAVENPTPSRVYELPPVTQYIQPYEYGHEFTKRTGLWLKNLPKLRPTNVVTPVATWCPSGSYSYQHAAQYKGVFTKDRAKNRSKTFIGIARAMAEQWGNL